MTDKIARKSSEDPTQEALRANKDSWNSATTTLIAKLIAFKRGLNGRGEPKAGIPPSSIKEPLPPELGQYLADLAQDYVSVVNGAESIIKEQERYSNSRRKSASAPEIVSVASWWGSQQWAKVHLFTRSQAERKLRLSVLSSAKKLEKEFRKLEYISTSKGLEGINDILSETFMHLKASQKPLFETLETLILNMGGVKTKELGESTSAKDIKPQQGPDRPAQAAPELNSEPILEEVRANIQNIGALSKNTNNADIKKLYESLASLIARIEIAERDEGEQKDPEYQSNEENAKAIALTLFKALQSYYNALNASSFDDIMTLVDLKKAGDLFVLSKFSQSKFKRWWSRRKLNINSSNIDKMFIQLSETFLEAESALNKTMDVVEDPSSTVEYVVESYKILLEKILQIIRQLSEVTEVGYMDIKLKPRIRESSMKALLKLQGYFEEKTKLLGS